MWYPKQNTTNYKNKLLSLAVHKKYLTNASVKTVIAYSIGMVLWTALAYGSAYLHVRWLMYIVAIAGLVNVVVSFSELKTLSKPNLERNSQN